MSGQASGENRRKRAPFPSSAANLVPVFGALAAIALAVAVGRYALRLSPLVWMAGLVGLCAVVWAWLGTDWLFARQPAVPGSRKARREKSEDIRPDENHQSRRERRHRGR